MPCPPVQTPADACAAFRAALPGATVYVYDNNSRDGTREAALAVEAQCKQLGAETLVFDVDVGSDAACVKAVDTVVSKWRRIDALINCAGTTRFIAHGDLAAVDDMEFERVYRVNLIGMFQMTRAAVPVLRDSSTAAHSTSVINISSLAALNGTGSSIAYAASKGAVNTLTLSLARNLAPRIRVNALAPGMVDDGLPRRVLGEEAYAKIVDSMTNVAPLKRVSQPGEIADLAWFIVAHAPSMTGQVIAAENGMLLNG